MEWSGISSVTENGVARLTIEEGGFVQVIRHAEDGDLNRGFG